MTKETKVRGPEDLFKKFEAEAKTSGKSMNQLIIEAMDHWLKCDKTGESLGSMHPIILKYDGKCKKCGTLQKAGSWALYGKGFGIICMDCYITRLGDKGIVKKFMKVKELKWTMKALEKQLEEKAEQLRQFNLYEVIEEMHKGYGEIYKLVMEYLKTGFDKPEKEKKALDELERLIQKQWAIIQEIELFIKGPPIKKKKKKPYVA